VIRHCRMCGRPVKVTFVQWLMKDIVFCPPEDVSGCIGTFKVLIDEQPPDEDEPPFPDPQDEQPPDDLWVCPSCEGKGEVFLRRDWETGAYETTECRPCRGTGDLRGQLAWA
jgi:hypothetical protein